MNNVLILTVGGSHHPLLRSIRQNRPDLVCFLCSDDCGRNKGSYIQVTGPGKVCFSRAGLDAPDLPNIVTQAGLTEPQIQVYKIREFDDLNACYLAAFDWLDRMGREHPAARIRIDYTGGTKSMSAGLAAAALDDGACEIQLVSGVRQDLVKVVDQTEFVRPVRVWDTQVARRLRSARAVLARYDYAGAARILEDAAASYASEATIGTVQRWLALCRGFDAWDRFDHITASRLLQPYRKDVVPYALFLDALLKDKGHGFELVEDLLRNAQRRAGQERYDDAVGRLYRGLELAGQTWLRLRYGVDASDVDLPRVPDNLRDALERSKDDKGIIKIGLLKGWDLISAFPDDPLGKSFHSRRRRLLNFLTIRNQSLFAHGSRPIAFSDYRDIEEEVTGFLEQIIGDAVVAMGKRRVNKLDQFPEAWD